MKDLSLFILAFNLVALVQVTVSANMLPQERLKESHFGRRMLGSGGFGGQGMGGGGLGGQGMRGGGFGGQGMGGGGFGGQGMRGGGLGGQGMGGGGFGGQGMGGGGLGGQGMGGGETGKAASAGPLDAKLIAAEWENDENVNGKGTEIEKVMKFNNRKQALKMKHHAGGGSHEKAPLKKVPPPPRPEDDPNFIIPNVHACKFVRKEYQACRDKYDNDPKAILKWCQQLSNKKNTCAKAGFDGSVKPPIAPPPTPPISPPAPYPPPPHPGFKPLSEKEIEFFAGHKCLEAKAGRDTLEWYKTRNYRSTEDATKDEELTMKTFEHLQDCGLVEKSEGASLLKEYFLPSKKEANEEGSAQTHHSENFGMYRDRHCENIIPRLKSHCHAKGHEDCAEYRIAVRVCEAYLEEKGIVDL